MARILTPESEHDRVAVTDGQRGRRMDSLREVLEAARTNGIVAGRFRGLLHIAIGRTVTKPDGTKVSAGATWRELSALLKNLRYDPELGREAGADPDTLSPRDRERYWYAVIALARVDGADARAEADQLVEPLRAAGFVVSVPPGAAAPQATSKPKPTPKPKADKPEATEDKTKKKKK
ncbi:hypothetical protein C1280_20140 [Gemmata obscuriglobus]|uniref:Uncharacterized protein n=2 Tax=Gemmata obscuriglobus TaxID=114 RepID=A0A2Z3HBN8_9BACT|nr:hypothetical protein C1280_20140 [Gemmata obscuriglobus]